MEIIAMAKYYVSDNSQANGDHEVHRDDCPYFPVIVSSTYLGEFSNCHDAVAAAKKIYPTADGCSNCLPDCHTS